MQVFLSAYTGFVSYSISKLTGVFSLKQVNHKLMGGLEVYIGDVYIDCSVASVVSRAEKIVRFGKDSTSA